MSFAALMLFASSCSWLSVPDEVGVHAVQVNLTFGAELTPAFVPPDIGELAIPPVIDLGELPEEKPVPPKPPFEYCPITTASAPKNVSRGEMDSGDIPADGGYLSQYEANFNDGSFQRFYAFKTVSAEENADGTAYNFNVRDDVVPSNSGSGNAVQGLEMSFQVVYTKPDPEPDGMSLTKLVLRAIEDEEFKEYAFVPNPPIQLFDFPIVQGTKLTRDAIDIEPKSDTPAGGGLLQPSGNNIKSIFEMGGREIIEVCADLAQAWRANWNIEITGEFNTTLSGTFWFDTSSGKGGMPIRSDYILTGDVSGGTFANSILRLDPGDFI